MMERRDWTRKELIAALNLYYKIPFSKITHNHKLIIELAGLIGRTPSSVSLKLGNFARLDPTLQKRNISGMQHGSKQDSKIWAEFFDNVEDLAYQSELILADYKHQSIEQTAGIPTTELPKQGKEREAIVKIRVNQSFFRKTILASYDNKCCVTGITNADLLIASHIKPWAVDRKNRMNPRNGLCLNALHDRAFDKGLITVTPDNFLKISKILKKEKTAYKSFFEPYENCKIRLPGRFLPDPEFFEYHNKEVYTEA
jgi:putative restriction endonuclease